MTKSAYKKLNQAKTEMNSHTFTPINVKVFCFQEAFTYLPRIQLRIVVELNVGRFVKSKQWNDHRQLQISV